MLYLWEIQLAVRWILLNYTTKISDLPCCSLPPSCCFCGAPWPLHELVLLRALKLLDSSILLTVFLTLVKSKPGAAEPLVAAAWRLGVLTGDLFGGFSGFFTRVFHIQALFTIRKVKDKLTTINLAGEKGPGRSHKFPLRGQYIAILMLIGLNKLKFAPPFSRG